MYRIKIIVKTLLVLLASLATLSGLCAQCTSYLGEPGFSGPDVSSMDMIADDNGDLFVAFGDPSGSLSVMRYDGSAWVFVGTSGFGFIATGVKPSLAFSNSGTLGIAYMDDASGGITVQEFDGTNWAVVGAPGFNRGGALDPSLQYNNLNNPVVIFGDLASSVPTRVMFFDGGSGNWTDVPNGGLPPSFCTDYNLFVSADGQTIVASFLEGGFVSTMLFDITSAQWVYLGGIGVYEAAEKSLDMVVADGELFISFSDFSVFRRASVIRFNGTSWEYVGISGFSSDIAFYTSVAYDDMTPYVTYVEQGTVSGGSVALKSFDGADWQDVAGSSLVSGAADDFGCINLSIIDQTPYVGFLDGEDNAGVAEIGTSVITVGSGILPVPVIDPSANILDCNNSTITLDANNSTGENTITFLWSTGSTAAEIEISNPGDYTVTVTDEVNGCSDEASVFISQGGPFAQIFSPTNILNTSNPTILLDATGSVGDEGGTYLWSDGSDEGTLLVDMAGTYFVTVTDNSNNCTGVDSITIFDSNNCAVISPSASALTCMDDNIILDASGSFTNGPDSTIFEWSNGIFQEDSIVITDPGDYWVYIITFTELGEVCNDTAFVTITENLLPPESIIEASPSTVLGCTTNQITLDAGSSSGQGTLNFQWGDGSTDASITVTEAGIYGLTVTDGLNGCIDSTDITITEDTTAIVANAFSNSPVCEGEELQLFNDNDMVQWQWEGPGGFASDQQNPTVASVTAAAEGTYSVTVTDVAGCTAVGTVDVAIDLPPNLEAFTSAPVCPGEDLELTAIVEDNILALAWITPDGDSLFNANTTVPSTDVVEGVYTLAYTGLNGCSATEQFDVAVLTEETILSNFLVGGFVCAGDSLRFIEYSGFEDAEGITFFWDFGNGDTSTERDPIYAYSQSGVYEISLVVNGGGSCPPITINKTVEVLACLQQGGEAPEVKASVNPTVSTGQFELQASLPENGSLGLSIYTLNGQLVYQEQFTEVREVNTELSLNDNGMYILRLSHDYGITTLRAIVIQ